MWEEPKARNSPCVNQPEIPRVGYRPPAPAGEERAGSQALPPASPSGSNTRGVSFHLGSAFQGLLLPLSCVPLCDPLDWSPPGSSVHGFIPTRILERVAISFSRGSSQPRDGIQISCLAGRVFTTESAGKPAFQGQTLINVY